MADDSDACYAWENPMERKRGEAGGRQPETTTGFEFEGILRRLFGNFRIRRGGMLIDPGVS